MNFQKYLTCLIFLLISFKAFSLNVNREFRDLKLPTQQMVEKQTFTNPAASGTNEVLNANAGNTSSAAVTVSTFVAQPDMARNLVMTPGGTTADVAECTVTINGSDFYGDSISEDFDFAENASSGTTGTKAFSSISSVVFPANCEDSPYGASWSIGYGVKLGIKRCMDQSGNFLFSTLNGTKEGTAPTIVNDVDEVEKNTVDFDGTLNGSNDFELFFFQNFRCLGS